MEQATFIGRRYF